MDETLRQRAEAMEDEGVSGVELELRRIRFVLTWIAVVLTAIVVVVVLGLGAR
jgi:hypothetical protein